VVALLTHANNAIVHTTGWPIGVVLENSPELKPRPTSEGIFVEIGSSFETYDYWALKLDGSFYLLRSLFEDDKYNVAANVLFFDTRITQVTEAFLYCYRLLTRLGIPPTSLVRVSVTHAGLRGRLAGSLAETLAWTASSGIH
jgi:hypothetical protein